jgi:RNA polymerase sigma factor (sigma-70 family)
VNLLPHLSEDELRALFNKVANGDESAFTTLFFYYNRYIIPFAEGKLKCEDSARELVQDVFLKVWLYRAFLNNLETPTAYLYRMVINAIYDRFGKLKKEYEFFKGLEIERTVEQESGHNLAHAHLRGRYQKALLKLPEERKRIFVMRQDGLTPMEIAKELRVSVNTVKTQLKRAFKTVRELLKESAIP